MADALNDSVRAFAREFPGIVAKIPDGVIKGAMAGGKTVAVPWRQTRDWLRILCLDLRVNDEPEKPFTVTMSNSSPQDAVLLRPILRSASTTLHCLN